MDVPLPRILPLTSRSGFHFQKYEQKPNFGTIGQSELENLTCLNLLALGASFSKLGRETFCFLLLKSLLYPYLTQNISGY